MSEHTQELTDANFSQEVLNHPQPVLVDFWAEWCAPCRTLSKVIDEVAADYDGRIKVGKMNIDEQRQIPAQHQVAAIPTLLLFKGGKVVETQVGLMKKAQLAQLLDKHLG